jgi:hypothetical protein
MTTEFHLNEPSDVWNLDFACHLVATLVAENAEESSK